jgi:putative RNA 2'-phosphotransferase
MNSSVVKQSKFLSRVLRHDPGTIGLTLDAQGWADLQALIELANRKGMRLSRERIAEIVAQNDKQRFALSPDGQRIRANQGHSIEVDLGLPPAVPPEVLFHGTATCFLDSIRTQGLLPGRRQHVHLSLERATALKVGQRHGQPALLVVRSGLMHAAGSVFHVADNGVWLTARVPVDFLEFPEP